MKLGESLIFATIFSYIGAAGAVLMGYPLMTNIPCPVLEGTLYLLAAVMLAGRDFYPHFKVLLGGLYGLMAMLSFSGVQQWINYYGVASLGPWMAVWDLAVAIAILTEV